MALTQTEILDGISQLTVIELKGLLDAFEEKFGVTAAAPMAMAVAGAPAGGGQQPPTRKKKTSLTSFLLRPVDKRSRSSRLYAN